MGDARPSVYACKHKSEQIRRNSTSGGVFSAIAMYVLKRGGCILAVRFDETFLPIYDFIESENDIGQFRGSKYAQACVGQTNMERLTQKLENDQIVLVIGTPCTINGIAAVYRNKYNNLLLMDFVCMGIASSAIWKRYLESTFGGEQIAEIIFKEKSIGWRQYSFVVKTDKQRYIEDGKSNLYMKGYLHKLFLRPSCYECSCKGLNRKSDITIADCWGIEDEYPDFDDNRGVSSIFLNTKIGRGIFNDISNDLYYQEISFEKATRKNHYYFDSAEKNYYRKNFFRELSVNSSIIPVLEKYQNKTRPFWIKAYKQMFKKN